MSAQHRRPLVAFFVVAIACGLIVGQGLRTQDIFDFIVGRSASSPAVVATSVTLDAQPADRGEPVRRHDASEPSEPTDQPTGSGGQTSSATPPTGSSSGAKAPTARSGNRSADAARNDARTPDQAPPAAVGSSSTAGSRTDLPGKSGQAHGRSVRTAVHARAHDPSDHRPDSVPDHAGRGGHHGQHRSLSPGLSPG